MSMTEAPVCVPDTSEYRLQNILKKLLHAKNLGALQLAHATNVPPATMYRLLNGTITDPKFSTLLAIAQFFSISVEQLMGLMPMTGETRPQFTEVALLPVLSWQNVVDYKTVIPTLNKKNWSDWFQFNKPKSKLAYCLYSKKHMVPRLALESVLIVDPNLKPRNTDLIVVHYQDVLDATVRQIIFDGYHTRLYQINREQNRFAPPEFLDSSKTILGVVLQSVLPLRDPTADSVYYE